MPENTLNMNYEEKRNYLKKLQLEIENKSYLQKVINKDDNLDEKIKKTETLFNIEENLNKGFSWSLRNIIKNKINNTDDVNKANELINNFSNVKTDLDNVKNKVIQWKILLEHIKSWNEITPEILTDIKSIVESTPYELWLKMWLNTEVLRDSSLSYYKKTKLKNNNIQKELSRKASIIEKKSNENKNLYEEINNKKSEINILKEKLLDETITETDKADIKLNIKNISEWLKEKINNFNKIKNENINAKKEYFQQKNKYISEYKELNEFVPILKETKNINIKKYDSELDNDFIETYKKEISKEELELENIYRNKISNNVELVYENIDETIFNDENINVDEIKDKINEIKEENKQKEFEEYNNIINKEDNNIKTIDSDNKIVSWANKKIQEEWKLLKEWKWKATLLAKKKLEEKEENNRKQEELKKVDQEISQWIVSIQNQIDALNKDYDNYKDTWKNEDSVISDFEYKLKSYKTLQDKLKDNSLSTREKKWIIWLMSWQKWLTEYVSHKHEKWDADIKEITRKVNELNKLNYEDIEENSYIRVFEQWLETQKFWLVENFAKIQSTIPNFENVKITDNLYAKAEKLWLSDEQLVKVQKLRKIQENIEWLNFKSYWEDFIKKSLDWIKDKKEKEKELLRKEKDKELLRISNTEDIDDTTKEHLQEEYLVNYDNKLLEINKVIEDIDFESQSIRDLISFKWKFSKKELEDIDNNLEIFNLLWNNKDKYGELFVGISDDITKGTTDFIDLRKDAHIRDYYTTGKLNSIIDEKINAITDNIKEIPSDNLELKHYRNNLIAEELRLRAIKWKIENGVILEDEVLDILSDKSLYSIDKYKESKELLLQLNDENTLDGDIDAIKEKLKENFSIINSINNGEELNSDVVIDTNWIYDRYNIDKSIILKELEDWFDNTNVENTAFDNIKWYGKNVKNKAIEKIKSFDNIYEETKVVWKTLFGWEKAYTESGETRARRQDELNKYFDALFSSGAAYIVVWIFKIFKIITDQFLQIPVYLDMIRRSIEKYRKNVFFILAALVWLIVIFADKSSLTYISLNTKLYSISNYIWDSWNIQFSDWLKGWIEGFFYKTNIYLYFLCLIVLYQIIIEFMNKYITILKTPTIWINRIFIWMWKLLVFFLFMWILFKVNSFTL